jgi:hypothetical protein
MTVSGAVLECLHQVVVVHTSGSSGNIAVCAWKKQASIALQTAVTSHLFKGCLLTVHVTTVMSSYTVPDGHIYGRLTVSNKALTVFHVMLY